MARLLPSLTVAYGVLVAAGGTYGFVARGSVPSLAAGGGLGLLVAVAGLLLARGAARARPVACVLVALVALAMAERLWRTGGLFPALPVIVLGVPLAVALARRPGPSARGGGAPGAPDGPSG